MRKVYFRGNILFPFLLFILIFVAATLSSCEHPPKEEPIVFKKPFLVVGVEIYCCQKSRYTIQDSLNQKFTTVERSDAHKLGDVIK